MQLRYGSVWPGVGLLSSGGESLRIQQKSIVFYPGHSVNALLAQKPLLS